MTQAATASSGSPGTAARSLRGVYTLAVGLSAFLLFLIQPMSAKALMPVFGGSYLVWGAAMVFFQTILLLGYGYAHWAQHRSGVLRYGPLHLILMLVPVLQRWYSEDSRVPREEPYFLYAASNVGSLTALLGYPVFVEPFLNLSTQRWVWWGGYGLLVGLHALCRPPRRRRPSEAVSEPVGEDATVTEIIPASRWAVWLLASAAGCAVSLAVTNVLTFDVASAPFLWVLFDWPRPRRWGLSPTCSFFLWRA